MITNSDIEVLGQLIINELGKELIKQQHRATGDLISSLDYTLNLRSIGFTLEILMNDYGLFVNTGRKPGEKKVPIQALLEWIKQKGIETNNKKALGIAFAIQKTIKKEGIPTRNSRAKGKRTEFIDETLDRVDNVITSMVGDLYEKQIGIQIDNEFRRI